MPPYLDMAASLASPKRTVGDLLGALPDLVTGIACIIVWVSPFAFGQDAVKTVVLMMVMEFMTVHATGFFTSIAFNDSTPPHKRLASMVGMLCFYGIFVAVFAYSFQAWWPVWVFAWLALSKGLWIFILPRDRAAEKERQLKAWVFSTVTYIAAVFAGLMLPLPELGITDALQPQLGLSGSGEWIEHPHVAVASMALYYFATAWFKWKSSGRRITA